MTEHFRVEIPEGLYFTDQRTTILQPALLTTDQATRLSFDGSYLADDLFNEHLFGVRGWNWRNLNQLVRTPNGGLGIGPVAEFQLIADWVQGRDAKGQRVDSLWIGRSNGEKWLLYQRPAGEVGQANRLITIPRFLLPLEDGVIAVGEDFVLARRSLSGEFKDEFEVQVGRSPARNESMVVANEGNGGRRKPLLILNRDRQQILFAGLPRRDAAHAATLSKRGMGSGDSANLYVLDLKSNLISTVVFDVRYPFTLTIDGIRRTQSGKNGLLPFDWGTHRLGAWAPFEGPAPTPAAPRQLERLKPEDLAHLQALGYPEDSLSELRSGMTVPLAYQPGVAERLAQVLARPTDALAILLYQDGQEPGEYLKSTFKALDLQATPNIAPLDEIENIFRLPQSLLLGARRKLTLVESLKHLKAVCEKKNTVLYFEDFPYNGNSPSTEALSSKLVQALKEFEQELGPVLNEGKCRIVWSIRQKLYEGLREHAPTVFGLGSIVQIDDPGVDLRREMAEMISHRLAQRFNLYLSGDAFRAAFEGAEKSRESQGALKIPGHYRTVFMDLYDAAALNAGLNATTAERTLSPELVSSYLALRDNRWSIELADWEPTPGDKRGKMPVWAKRNGPRPEKIDALTEAQYTLWKADPARLTHESRFSHALFTNAPADPNGGTDATAGSIDVLVANHQTIRALEFVPAAVKLHPRGFYFLRVDRFGELDKREATLCFFDLVKALELGSDLQGTPEGVIRILRGKLSVRDFNDPDKVLSLIFEDDLAIIQREGAVLGNAPDARAPKTYFGPEGELK